MNRALEDAAEDRGALSDLPETFTYADALAAGLTRHRIYQLRSAGTITPLARGLYRRSDGSPADLDLLAIAHRCPRATICLATALARHGLSDAIPAAPDIALPRGTRIPTTPAQAEWHLFDRATFDLGRLTTAVDDTTQIGLYSAERSIIDAFRTRGREGHELGHDALRRWLRTPGAQPGQLFTLAQQFPRAAKPLRLALEVLR